MPKAGIRSVAHRKILQWLSKGPSTVSEIAQQFSMRMPHASLACRQLRASGDIVRDETQGIRMAPLYLSHTGMERLKDDALARVRRYVDEIPPSSQGVILQSEASHVLVGYVEPPTSPLLFVPNTATTHPSISNGNKGGSWLLCLPDAIEWFDVQSLEPTSPPTPTTTRTLADFGGASKSIGLVRGEVLEHQSGASLTEGSWFSPPQELALPAQLLSQGLIALGTIGSEQTPYIPPMGLHAHLVSRLDRTLVLKTLGQDSQEFSERRRDSPKILTPFLLRAWLRLLHPRLSDGKLVMRLKELIKGLEKQPPKLPAAQKRALLADFGTLNFSDFEGESMHVLGFSEFGMRALCEGLIRDASRPFLLDWMFDSPSDDLLNRLVNHPQCRLVLTRANDDVELQAAALRLESTKPLGQVGVCLRRGLVLPVDLVGEMPTGISSIQLDRLPASAQELLTLTSGIQVDTASFTGEAPGHSSDMIFSEAIDAYPTGNDELANRIESNHPLAAWIASPPEDRIARWTRLSRRLPKRWIDLVSPEAFSLSQLAQVVGEGGSAWQSRALRRLALELPRSPEIILELFSDLQESSSPSYLSSAILVATGSLGEEFEEISSQACSVWLNDPKCVVEVLEAQFPIGKELSESQFSLLDMILSSASIHAPGSVLSIWKKAIMSVRRKEPWTIEQTRLIMKHLPESWWSAYASEWLLIQLATASGRAWLVQHPICWPAQLGRVFGERCGFPGTPTEHPGFQLSQEAILPILLLGDGLGLPALLDVHDMARASLLEQAPSPLRLHPYCGWLAQPTSRWPTIDASVIEQGDRTIALLLYARYYASQH
ncbi:MAG: hypothetical protein L7S56_08035 [Candidatus Poseidonia sp.]|nr:hypothetical protein [Poseidonia sp.]